MNFMDDIKEQLLKKEFEYDAVDADRGKMDRNASAIINALENSGYEAYAVGGCVRDLLLAKAPHDWDITTSARSEEHTSELQNRKKLFPLWVGMDGKPLTVPEGGSVRLLSLLTISRMKSLRLEMSFTDRTATVPKI